MGQIDLFHTLCQDIIAATRGAESESEAVSIALMRTWRWHHLLRGGTGSPLSLRAQMGLLAELIVLERHILPNLSAATALAAWRGPLDSPKDFEMGRVAIEVKARRGGATSLVTITSEDQLDESGMDSLFLYVIELSQVPAEMEDGMSVQDLVDRIRAHLGEADPGSLQALETLLLAAGLNPEDDYSDSHWLVGPESIYLVDGEFPRITNWELRSGVSRVQYTVSLGECEPFAASAADLVNALKTMGERDGD